MLSVVIATKNVERALVPTLGSLISAAAAGAVREVILADGGSEDQTTEVGDIAGCRVLVSPESAGARLKAAAAAARSSWLMFLRPGLVLDSTWADETLRFIESTERSGRQQAAVFRLATPAPRQQPALAEALWLLRLSLGARPRPDQALVIGKDMYREVGGHAASAEAPEEHLLRRIGRRRLTLLRSAATRVQDT